MSFCVDRLDQLRRLPLAAVLRETGAQRDRYDQAKWNTPHGAISITGMKFMNWKQRPRRQTIAPPECSAAVQAVNPALLRIPDAELDERRSSLHENFL